MSGTPSIGRPSVANQLPTQGEQKPPTLPSDLTGEHAIALWRQAVQDLPHALRQCDFAILRLTCEAYQKAMDAFSSGDEKTALASSRLFGTLAKEIGLSPSSRRVVRPAPTDEKQEPDEFDKWLSRRGLSGRV